MNPYVYQRLYQEIRVKQSIDGRDLKYISILKNCGHWDAVQELGTILYKNQYAHYDGLIVHYQQGIYYLPQKTLQVLKPFRKWAAVPKLTVEWSQSNQEEDIPEKETQGARSRFSSRSS